MGDNSVLSLFELTACVVSSSLDNFPRESIEDLPVTILSALVEYLSAYHLELYEDVFQKHGINVSRAWMAHFKKRWTQSYQYRSPVFKTRDPPSYKHRYLQKHFHDCLQAILTDSAFDPTTPFRQPLRNEPAFLAKPMVKSRIEKDLVKYAKYANTLITLITRCNGIKTRLDLLKTLQKSTKVLETFVPHRLSNVTASLGNFIELCRILQLNGCLEELHVHFSSGQANESPRIMQILRECAGQDVNAPRPDIKSRLPFLLGIPSRIKPEDAASGSNHGNGMSVEGDLYDEALSTLESRKSEKEFEQLLEATVKTVDNESGLSNDTNSGTKDFSEGRQLTALACYDIHCCRETARDFAYLFMAWDKLEKLAIHYFGGADKSLCEDNDPDFALLCQVLLHKVREHRLTQLILMEHAVHPGPLRAVVKFYTALVAVLNKDYAINSDNEKRPMEYLRIPIICAMEDTALFGGKKINLPVRAVEDLRVDLDPTYPQNRNTAAESMAAFVTSFIQFDAALTSLTIKDSAGYMFRASDDDIVSIASALAGNSRITVIELDINLTSQIAVEAVVNMIGQNQNLTSITLKRVSVDWEQQQVKDLQEKLIAVVKHHQSLTNLVLKGRVGRGLNGTFLVDFVVKLFYGPSLPKLQQLDISETGITTDDLLRMMSELKCSPCAPRFPALESLSVRNTVKSPNLSLETLTKVKRELKILAYVLDVTFEERFGFLAEFMAQV